MTLNNLERVLIWVSIVLIFFHIGLTIMLGSLENTCIESIITCMYFISLITLFSNTNSRLLKFLFKTSFAWVTLSILIFIQIVQVILIPILVYFYFTTGDASPFVGNGPVYELLKELFTQVYCMEGSNPSDKNIGELKSTLTKSYGTAKAFGGGFCTAIGVQQGTLMSLSSSKLIGTATASSKKLHLGILGASLLV